MLPESAIELLPESKVLLQLTYDRKEQSVKLNRHYMCPAFDKQVWINFVKDNDFVVDDICIFEVFNSTFEGVKLKVVILKVHITLPEELQKTMSGGLIVDDPIHVDQVVEITCEVFCGLKNTTWICHPRDLLISFMQNFCTGFELLVKLV